MIPLSASNRYCDILNDIAFGSGSHKLILNKISHTLLDVLFDIAWDGRSRQATALMKSLRIELDDDVGGRQVVFFTHSPPASGQHDGCRVSETGQEPAPR
jgi:hypothetical protein